MERLVLKAEEVQIIGFEKRGDVGLDEEHTATFPAFGMGIHPHWLNITSQQ